MNISNKTKRVKIFIEEWKSIKGYKNHEVSNTGKIRNINSNIEVNGNKSFMKDNNMYHTVQLYNGKRTSFRVNRLVAEYFVENDDPDNKIQVNHKDGNKYNNWSSNLEWCTPTENTQHAVDNGLSSFRVSPIYQIKDGIIIAEYPSIKDAERATGIKCIGDGVRQGCKIKGYNWEYQNEKEEDSELDNEIWKPVTIEEGYDHYEVSNFGRVRKIGSKKTLSEYKRVYNCVTIYHKDSTSKNRIRKNKDVHLLVANEFLNKGDNDTEVRHIDGDPKNNHVSNLEWSTRSKTSMQSKKLKETSGKKVYKIDPKTNKILQKYSSIGEAARDCGKKTSTLQDALHGRTKTAANFKWIFAD